MRRAYYLLTLVLLPLLLISCSTLSVPQSTTFSFEQGMEGWTTSGTDLDNPPDQWSIEPSGDMASKGTMSLKLYLDNANDAGKIWIERYFDVEPESYYHVYVSYDFASADYGDVNLWTIITGVVLEPPKTAGELVYQRDTGNGADADDGWKWLHKTYDFNIRSGPEKQIYVIVGVWGTWETARTYYLDNVDVTITKEK
jgi:hypothetical protein